MSRYRASAQSVQEIRAKLIKNMPNGFYEPYANWVGLMTKHQCIREIVSDIRLIRWLIKTYK